MRKNIIGLFCGSFNPPLYSHLALAEQILNYDDNIKKIIFVPVSNKYNKDDLIENSHRFNMLNLICNENNQFEVSNIEFNYNRQPFTLETLRRFSKVYPGFEIRLIIGTDNLKTFDTWYHFEELLNNFKIIVVTRNNDNMHKIINQNPALANYSSSFLEYKLNLTTNLSSTYVRNLIKQGKSVKYLLPDNIIDYIKNNKLYL